MILVDRAGRVARFWRHTKRRPVALFGGAIAAAALVIALATGQGAAPGGGAAARPHAAPGRTPEAFDTASPLGLQPPTRDSGDRSAEAVEEALYGRGSLRHSQPDGGWKLDGAGALLPDIGVRRRFDHLLTALGEATVDEIGRLLRAQATRELSTRAVEQAMALWQSYLQLLGHAYTQNADIGEPRRWQAALDERVRVRRELLGPAWADAFYRDEELAVRANIVMRLDPSRRVEAADSTALAGALPDAARRPRAGDDLAALQRQRVAEFGVEAAERLAQEDAAQQQWERRLSQARQRISEWQGAPELSAAQRRDAVERFLGAEFDSGERLRVRALLKLEDAP